MKLSPKQLEAQKLIETWFKDSDKQRFVLAGFAGTGKSTIAKFITDSLDIDSVHYIAYTGKAANVLRDKGCRNASTIHGAIYKLLNPESSKPEFALDPEAPISKAPLVIVDEYSMLPESLIRDLESVVKRVLYLGDPEQLPPVSGECPLEPDFFLDEVHRQALDSNIIKFATMVREGKKIPHCEFDDFICRPMGNTSVDDMLNVDQIIVGKNDTRKNINRRFREHLGHKTVKPIVGEKVICLRNNHNRQIFNGMITRVAEPTKDCGFCHGVWFMEVEDVADKMPVNAHIFDSSIDEPHWQALPEQINQFDFAYAITCHKSQGSEFGSVLIFNQPIGRTEAMRRRWLYTAITRAKDKVILIV